jgi:hypothetical protein
MPILAIEAAVDMSTVYKLTRPNPEGPNNIASTLVRAKPIKILITDDPPMMDEVFRMRL